ncbi:MAG: hypothetical protein U0X87_02850 [Anaerolineales bacterium]
MTETTLTQQELNTPSLPAWKVIWEMIRFRPWLDLIDLLAVGIFRFSMQVAPALIIKAFFDMITGSHAHLRYLGDCRILIATWLGRVLGGFGFYYADVPIFQT